MKTRLTLPFAVLSVSCFCLPVAFADTCGQLAAVKGQVEILRMQAAKGVRYGFKVLRSAEPVECDDVILTGRDSSVKVVLPNAKLSLGPDSRFEIAAHAGRGATSRVSLLNLTYGKLRALVNKKKSAGPDGETEVASPSKTGKDGKTPQATFRVKTFSAVVGVRGTDFYTSYEPNSGVTEQATIEGSVEVAQTGTEQKVLVEGGHQVAVTTAPQVLAAARRDEATQAGVQANPESPTAPAPVPVVPLKVVPIEASVKSDIRVASAIVKDDADFTHAKAVETLGQPATWVLEREKVPEKLKDIKNEF